MFLRSSRHLLTGRGINFLSHTSASALSPLPSSPWKVVESKQSLFQSLAQLSKPKLSALVLLTSLTGYIAAPLSIHGSSPGHMALMLTGTALCSASANTFNQWAEAPLDAQMSRTKGRPLPRLAVTPLTAFTWACVAGGSGVGLLAASCGVVPAGWAAMTVILYAGVYTPLKRLSLYNTWIGAVVGAIPPLIGWSAVDPSLSLQALFLPGLLYMWQFPHFMALSWNLRAEYARAGYQMASLLNPALNRRVALRYSLALVPLTLAATPLWLDLCEPAFGLTGNLANLVLLGGAFRFWRDGDETAKGKKAARRLFFLSLIHLPVVMGLFLYHRKRQLQEQE